MFPMLGLQSSAEGRGCFTGEWEQAPNWKWFLTAASQRQGYFPLAHITATFDVLWTEARNLRQGLDGWRTKAGGAHGNGAGAGTLCTNHSSALARDQALEWDKVLCQDKTPCQQGPAPPAQGLSHGTRATKEAVPLPLNHKHTQKNLEVHLLNLTSGT